MKYLCLAVLLFFTVAAYSQNEGSLVKLLNPETVAKPNGYSHVAEVDLGTCKMLILSGQVGLDQKGTLVGKGDVARQTEQAFDNIRKIVEASGGTMDHIVKLGYFMTDVKQIQGVREVRNRFFNMSKPPASTLVQVSGLFREDILIEIEATAIIPK